MTGADRPFTRRAPETWIEGQGSRSVRDARWEVPREPGDEIFIFVPRYHDLGDEDARARAGSWQPGTTWVESAESPTQPPHQAEQLNCSLSGRHGDESGPTAKLSGERVEHEFADAAACPCPTCEAELAEGELGSFCKSCGWREDRCGRCGKIMTWDGEFRGRTIGGLWVVGARACVPCGEREVCKRSRPIEPEDVDGVDVDPDGPELEPEPEPEPEEDALCISVGSGPMRILLTSAQVSSAIGDYLEKRGIRNWRRLTIRMNPKLNDPIACVVEASADLPGAISSAGIVARAIRGPG